MDEVTVDMIEVDGNNYYLIYNLSDEKNHYYYFSNVNNNQDIRIFKDRVVDGEDSYVNLDDAKEFDYALKLIYEELCN